MWYLFARVLHAPKRFPHRFGQGSTCHIPLSIGDLKLAQICGVPSCRRSCLFQDTVICVSHSHHDFPALISPSVYFGTLLQELLLESPAVTKRSFADVTALGMRLLRLISLGRTLPASCA